MSTVDSGEGNFDFSNLVVIVKVKLFLGVGHKSTSRLYSVIFGSSLRGPNTEAGGKSAYINVQVGVGPNIKIGTPIYTDNASWGGPQHKRNTFL